MPRIPQPATIADTPEASRPLLDAVVKQLGSAPNLFRLVATSPQALEGYLALSGALSKGALPAATREQVLAEAIRLDVPAGAVVYREGDAARTAADTSRIRAELGWEPLTEFQEGLAAQWRWAAARVARA